MSRTPNPLRQLERRRSGTRSCPGGGSACGDCSTMPGELDRRRSTFLIRDVELTVRFTGHAESRMVWMTLPGALLAQGWLWPLCSLAPAKCLRQVHRTPLTVDRVEDCQVAQRVHQRDPAPVLRPMIVPIGGDTALPKSRTRVHHVDGDLLIADADHDLVGHALDGMLDRVGARLAQRHFHLMDATRFHPGR